MFNDRNYPNQHDIKTATISVDNFISRHKDCKISSKMREEMIVDKACYIMWNRLNSSLIHQLPETL